MKRQILAILLLASIVACKKDSPIAVTEIESAENIAPNGFTFSTTKSVKIHVSLLTNISEPIANIPVTLYNAANGNQLLKSLTDNDGNINIDLNIASYIDKIIVKNDYVGLNNEVLMQLDNNSLNLIIGGPKGLEGNFIVAPQSKSNMSGKTTQSIKTLNANYSYLGTYDNNGRPNYLTTSKAVSKSLLDKVNASLPSTIDVRSSHAEYLFDKAKQTIDMVKNGDVLLTFVSESAGLKNSIAYYTYATNNPPASASQISDIKIIFPNSSLVGSDGGLITGDRVNLGNFTAGTSIAFVLIQNGWDAGNKTVKTGNVKYFGNKNFNPENDSELKKHTVLLSYPQENLFVLGIEDLDREDKNSGCDHDFNDALFFAESSTKDAISTTGVALLDTPKDTDKDGVSDQFDEYPTDPTKAYNNYFPSKENWGTLAFEDNWPLKGDYDMNDLGLNYRYTYVTNAGNKVVEMTADYKVNSALAYFHNGFGVELPFNSSVVASTSGQVKAKNYIQTNANGTEAGQSKAVIIAFDDQKAITNPNGLVSVNIKFTSPQASNILSSAPYNPFLISDGRRSYEIHLPGNTPTSLADKNLFGYQDDKSNPGAGKYYIGTDNWPWALQFTEPFTYPAESKAVNDAYSKFGAWAASGGTKFNDWYK